MNKNILIVGVGGQGTLLASKLLGAYAQKKDHDVKVSEVHGMSQRGGSVVTYVKLGEKINSPIIDLGEADVIISFEQLEAARYLPYLKKGGCVITNTQKIDPMPVITGNAVYPDGIPEKIAALGIDVVEADALSLACEAGSQKCVNVVLLGVAAVKLGLDIDVFREVVRENVPAKLCDVNIKAFDLGVAAAK